MMQLNADTTTDTTTTTTTTTGASGEADGRVLRVAEGLESPFDVKMMHASKQPTCQSTVFIFLVLGGGNYLTLLFTALQCFVSP